MIISHGGECATLGNRILRAETAPIAGTRGKRGKSHLMRYQVSFFDIIDQIIIFVLLWENNQNQSRQTLRS